MKLFAGLLAKSTFCGSNSGASQYLRILNKNPKFFISRLKKLT